MKPILAAAALLALAATAAPAASVAVVDPADFLSAPGPTVAEARYRLSNTNWDMAIVQPGGPNGSTPTAGLGNVAQLSARTFGFTLRHTAGTGFSFTMTNTADATNTATVTYASLASFNALQFEVRSITDTGAMSVSDFAFTYGAGLTGPSTIPNLSVAGNVGFLSTWLASLSDLSLFDWSVTGTIAGSKGITGGDETVRLSIRATNVELPAPIPLPAAGFLLIGAMAGLGLLACRRRAAA
jgi:hypothetical protein